jgi:proteasome accessory factor B
MATLQAHMDRVERLTNLLLVLLDAQRPLPLQEIVHTVDGYPGGHDAYRQAFERDKRILREEGIVITVEPLVGSDQFGYRIRPEDYYLPELGLSDEEGQALNLAVSAVRWDESAGQQAAWRLGRGGPSAPLAELPSLPALPVAHDAIRARAPLTFVHRGMRRTMDPYGLAFRNGFWYLVGRDHERDAVRSFRVDRLEGTPQVGMAGSYELPANFDLLAAVPGDPWTVGDGDAITARVAIDAVMAALVEAELGSDAVIERRADGSIVVSLPVVNMPALRSWLLQMLDHAELLDPASMRADVMAWLEALAGGHDPEAAMSEKLR